MLYLSEVLIQEHDLETFDDLVEEIQKRSGSHIHFKIDVKPQFPDTPANWEDRLEGAFVGINSITR